jgi:hypothetical protein
VEIRLPAATDPSCIAATVRLRAALHACAKAGASLCSAVLA